MTSKDLFIELLQTACEDRFDTTKFIDYLQNQTDFFEAPASTKFHLSVAGGLVEHSLDVYKALSILCKTFYPECKDSTIVLVALLHDLCKVNFYKQELRNVKEDGRWVAKLQYVVDDELPIGHGEKSVIMLLRQGVPLTDEEIYAIRWHMSGFDNAFRGGEQALGNAYKKSKLVVLLQAADLIATHALEADTNLNHS